MNQAGMASGPTHRMPLDTSRLGRSQYPVRDSESAEYYEILEILDKGRLSLKKLRCRNATIWLLLSVFSALLFGVWFRSGVFASYLQDKLHSTWVLQLADFVDVVLGETLFCSRLLLPTFAPLADAVWFMRLALLTDVGIFTYTRVSFVEQRWGEWNDLSAYEQAMFLSWAFRGIAFVCCALWAMSKSSQLAMQRWMWRSIAVWAVLTILHNCAALVLLILINLPGEGLQLGFESGACFKDACFKDALGEILVDLLLLYIVSKPELLLSFSAKIRRKMETEDATCAAASVACLIGSTSPMTVIEQAKKHFRCVSFTDVMFEDVSNNTPNPSLGLRAGPVQLGCCDAFLSHSWHDDPIDKWKAMQSWAGSFRAREGREPKIWFDKFCIDQNNIEMDLQCLPIFLSGCKRLVILCGTTYLSRLWCVIEVFTYIMMGGRLENVDVVPVLKDNGDDDEMEGINASFENFDTANCNCFNAGDKDRLLLVIRTAFGSLSAFNEQVSGILQSFLQSPVISAQLSLASPV